MSWLGFEGKSVIVTGGAMGTGLTLCEALAAAGANVAVADMNEEIGKKAAGDLKDRFGGDHMFVPVNVADSVSVKTMVESVLKARGKIDIIVNNAGINMPRLLVDPEGKEELTEEIWDRIVAVNQKGVFLCTQAAAREMITSGIHADTGLGQRAWKAQYKSRGRFTGNTWGDTVDVGRIRASAGLYKGNNGWETLRGVQEGFNPDGQKREVF